MARARLFSPLGVTRGSSADIDDVATVGRDRDHAVVIDDGLISKDHARIAFDADWNGFLLEDLGSTNGTALDGVPVIGRERLDQLHVITFAGRHEFVFQDLRPQGEQGAPMTRPAAATAPAGAARKRDPTTDTLELTRHGHEPMGVPAALADVLDAPTAVERTQSHELPPAIPQALAGDADQQTDAPPESEPAEALPAEARPAEAEPSEARPAEALPAEALPAEALPSAAGMAPISDSADGASASTDGALPLPEEPAAPLPGSPSPYVLEVMLGEGRRERYTLHYGDNLIGRINAAEVQLKNEHISRRHAVISIGDTLVLRDRGSNNHTFLRGEQVEGKAQIKVGDPMRFGPLEARLIRQELERRDL